MKILAILGSPRANGNTEGVTRLILERLQRLADARSVPLQVETVRLARLDIRPCRGCRACFDRGEDACPCRADDLPSLRAQMLAADGLLVASPVYVDDVSGITKNWIDRLAHACHRPVFGGRVAFAVATVGGSPTGHTLRTLTMALRTWGYTVVGQAGFKMGARMDPGEVRQRFERRAGQAARALFDAIDRRAFERPSFFSLMVFKIQQRAWQRETDKDSLDYRFWQAQGWLAQGCTYYYPHHAGRLKVALARLAGAMIAPFVAG